MLQAVTEAKRKLLRRNKHFLTSMLTHLARAAARAQSLLLRALIRIPTSGLSRYCWIPKCELIFCASYLTKNGNRMSSQHSRLAQYHFQLLCPNWNYVIIIEDACTRSIQKRHAGMYVAMPLGRFLRRLCNKRSISTTKCAIGRTKVSSKVTKILQTPVSRKIPYGGFSQI